MVDLFSSIVDIANTYRDVQGDSAKELIRKNYRFSYNDLVSLYNGFSQEVALNQGVDLWKLWSACYAYSILQLPVTTENPQDPKITPELASHILDNLGYLAQSCNIICPKANDRAIAKISEGVNVSETFPEILEWAKHAKAFHDMFGTDINYVINLVSIRAKVKLYEKCSTSNKDEILKNLENLLIVKKLGVPAGEADNIVIDYALKWVEDINDIKKFKAFKGEPVIPDPDTSKKILDIVNQLEVTDEKLQDRIKLLNELFPIFAEPVVEEQSRPITQRSQIAMGPAIFVRSELNVNQCRIMWKGKQTDAVIKTYKEQDGYKSAEKLRKEVEILQKLSGTSRFFLEFYGSFYDEIVENNVIKYCSNVVMEYCPYSLTELIKSRASQNNNFTPTELNSIVLDLLEAFLSLVNHKIYHQDIKPDNILITKEGQLKIADFNVSGIRETIENTYAATGVHDVIGTASYMAPELRYAMIHGIGKAKYRPERADVFSLGLIFYQLATFDNIARFNEDSKNREKVLQNVTLPWLRELLYDMLCFEYKDRLSFRRALKKVAHDTTMPLDHKAK
ncbi:unnamed protein product [Blepharisma stoltei]|uniref:Protein kinase domain-containing protein n=1 Tax=Blepharisma stoltei TaxID=1481888 RepID=A0AAU9IBF6_9CILI|nr:unnamed protein product [Blepharisma stoltei]